MQHNVCSNTVYNSQDVDATQIKKMWYIHRCTLTVEYYVAIRMKFEATWMELDIIIVLSEVRQRKTSITWNHISVESKNINEPIYKTERDSQVLNINLWLSKGRGNQEGTNKEYGIDRY